MEVVAACHLHSTWSYDGSWALEALRDRFSRRGCRVLLMTEHDRGFTQQRFQEYREACLGISSNDILVTPGIEYSDADNRIHILVWGAPFLGEGLPTLEMLNAVRAADGIAVMAHPSRRDAWKYFKAAWADRLAGIELWNRKYDGWAPSKTAPALLEGSGAMTFVGLDFHTAKQAFPLGMRLDLQSDTLDENAVLNCLKSRRCYPLAFGLPLGHDLLRTSMPALTVAERGRRKAASIVKRSRLKSAKPGTP